MATLLDVPEEVLLQILLIISIKEILRLRQACRHFHTLTIDTSLWTRLLREQRDALGIPFSSDLAALLRRQAFDACPLTDRPGCTKLEDHYRFAHGTAQRWATSCYQDVHKIPRLSRTLLGFRVFLDKYLLCVYGEGLLQLWHLAPEMSMEADERPATQLLSYNVGDISGAVLWDSFCARIDPSLDFIVVAVNGAAFRTTHISLFRIDLPTSESISHSFDESSLLSTIDHLLYQYLSDSAYLPQFARVVDPTLRAIIFTNANTVEVLPYQEQPPDSCIKLFKQTIDIQTYDLEEVWNGVVAARIMGPYLVLFRLISIELYPLNVEVTCKGHSDHAGCPHYFPHGLPLLQRYFNTPEGNFRQVSVSEPTSWPQPPDSSGYVAPLKFTCLHFEPTKGILLHELTVQFQPQENNTCVASVEVSEVAAAAIGDSSSGGIFATTAPGISTGFVGALALGPQGKRAAWIERKRAHTYRDVMVWAKGTQPLGEEIQESRMVGHAIYQHKSFDLREDLIHCAIAESTGRIILGNRLGEILIL